MHAELTCQLAKRLVTFASRQCDTRLKCAPTPTRHRRCPCGLHLPGHSPEPPHRLKLEPTSNINVLVQISGSSSTPPQILLQFFRECILIKWGVLASNYQANTRSSVSGLQS